MWEALGKFLDLPESVSSSTKWDSYLWEVTGRVDRKIHKALDPVPFALTPSFRPWRRGYAELWQSWGPQFPGYYLLECFLDPLSHLSCSLLFPQQASPRSLLYPRESAHSPCLSSPSQPFLSVPLVCSSNNTCPWMLTWVDTFSSLLGILVAGTVLGSDRYLINATHGTPGQKSCFVQAGVPAHETTPLCGESWIIITILKKSIKLSEILYLFSKIK